MRSARSSKNDAGRFDKAAAAETVKFIQGLRHFIGEWSGEPFTLLDWQRRGVVEPLFGRLNADGFRRHRWAYIEVPKKNGKSHLAAAIALYLLCADSELGAEIYGAGYDRDQAAIIFRIAKQMVLASEELSDILVIHDSAKRIVDRETGSFYEAVSRETLGAHGYNPHAVIFDELHTQRNRELWDTLTMGMGARRQPLVFAITTAGAEGESPLCKELHNYSRRVLAGTIKDPTWFAYIRGAPKEADWTDRKVWKAANPSFGVTISEDFLREQCDKAKRMPSFENAFRRFHLNQWLQQATRWMPLREWDACGGAVDVSALAGRECFGGLDLASSIDIAAFVLVFAGDPIAVLPFFWIPEDTIAERSRKDGVPYDVWARMGLVEPTPGNFIDHRVIRQRIVEIGQQYPIRSIAFDPFNAAKLTVELAEEDGFDMIQFRQGFLSMSPPTKEIMRLVLGRRIRHGGNPVLRWMADNCVARTDPAANIKLDREKSADKIDGMVALVMALDLLTRLEKEGQSVYEDREVLVI
ncbi:hypothetical protein LCGC14_1631730 [marine sediment metagenome]|uniref:Terminase large subunit n=1 Tax=marine sediment metagenome TaxID=412755 RepID=A0A0F9I2F0_9ZZZZ